MSNPKVTDLVAVEQYYSNVDVGNSYRGTAHVPAPKNRKVTELVAVENYYSTGDDAHSINSYDSSIAHDVQVPDNNHSLDHDNPSPVPNCVLKMNRCPKAEPALIKALLLERLKRRRIITLDVEGNTVAICGDVNPATIVWTVSDCAKVGAVLVFYKEHQGIRRPHEWENFVFRSNGNHYSNRANEEFQKTKGIKSFIVDSSSHSLWMSISGDCFDAGVIRDKIWKICDPASKYDVKDLSKKRANYKDLHAANNMTNIVEGCTGALVSMDDPVVSNTLPKNHRADEAQITVDFIVPRKYQRECATEINEMLLYIKGVRFVIIRIHASRLTSVKVWGDDRLELDTILKTVSFAGGIKPRLRKSFMSQLILAFCSFCG